MPNLKDIVYCSEEQLETMASGTPVGGHEYNEDDLYITSLGEDIVVGSDGSGTKINENNELVVDKDVIKSLAANYVYDTDAERLAALLRMGCTVDDNGFVKWTAQEV